MHISLLAINCAAVFVFHLLFWGMLKGTTDYCVSTFWAAVYAKAKSPLYWLVMWVAAAAAALSMLSPASPGYALGAWLIQTDHYLTGALVLSLWLTSSFSAATFAVGFVGFLVYEGLSELVRRALGRPRGPVVVG